MQQQYHTHAHTHTNTHTHTRRRARDVCWFSCRLSGARPLTLSLCRLRAAVRVSGPCRCAPPRLATVALGLETMAEQLPSPLPPSSRSAPPRPGRVCVYSFYSLLFLSRLRTLPYRDYVPCPPGGGCSLFKTTHSSVEGLLSVAITTETAARDGVERLVPRRDVEGVPQLLPPSPRALLLMRELMLIRLQNKS